MKKILPLLFVILTIAVAPAFTVAYSTTETVPLKITYYATGTIKGYSYSSKMQVLVDGNEVGESPVKNQEVSNSFTVQVPKGNHELKCIMWAQTKEGVWEERLEANGYSFDWTYSASMNFKKKNKLKIEFNITNRESVRH